MNQAVTLLIYAYAHVSFALQGLPGNKGERGEKVDYTSSTIFLL